MRIIKINCLVLAYAHIQIKSALIGHGTPLKLGFIIIFHYCSINIGRYFLCPFVLIQKNEKINSRLKTFGKNFSSTDTRKE